MEADVILSMRNVTKSFPNVLALDHVSFEILKGQVHGIVGENGAGKSTLMKILSGVYKRSEGEIYFDGRLLNVKKPIESLRAGLSIIYQEFNLVNQMSVGENILLGRFKEFGSLKKIHAEARRLLDQIGSSIDTYRRVEELAVSEKQMVEICKALSFDSRLIIMDEPSTTLTVREMDRLKDIIRDLKSRGITVIYISHKLDEIMELCDRVTVMRDGRVISTRDIEDVDRVTMISEMVGRSIENEYPPRLCPGDGVLLEVSDLCTNKLKNISFTLKHGEILGLVGLVGSGRTETVRAIFGADKRKSGKIALEGRELEIRNPIDAKAAGLVALGMTAVIIGGYIDLSCAGIFSFMGIVSGLLLNSYGDISILMILVIGGLCGLLDAAVILFCGARDDSDALFITFGAQSIFTALAFIANNGNLVSLNERSLTTIVGSGKFLGLPVMFFIFLALSVVLFGFMKKTTFGREIYLAGGNPVASRLSGINVRRVTMMIYIIIGVLTALAAYVQLCRVGSATPTAGRNFETNAILAVAIGGTSLSGGKGSVLNTILGVTLVTVMVNALNILGISSNMQFVWKGIILVAAIWIDSRRNK